MKARNIVLGGVLLVFVSAPAAIMLYSGTWPPIYTVESQSMEHSSNWTSGSVNVGDIVLVKNIENKPSNVVTYVEGRVTGHSTYGEYGDVILYKAPSNEIVVHRAMFYLSWDNGNPVVSGFTGQSWMKVTDSYVVIDNASYTNRNLIVYLNNLVNKSGFITVGDYNLAHSQLYNSSENAYVAADQNVFGYNPAAPNSIEGVAFGQIPWFGLIKLNLMRIAGDWPQYNEVPAYAYLYLLISVSAIVSLVVFPYGRVLGRRGDKP